MGSARSASRRLALPIVIVLAVVALVAFVAARRRAVAQSEAPAPRAADEDYAITQDIGSFDAIGYRADGDIYGDLTERDVGLVIGTVARVEVTAHKSDPNKDPESGGHDDFGGVLHLDRVETFRGAQVATVALPFFCHGGSYRTAPEGFYPCPRRGDRFVVSMKRSGETEGVSAHMPASDNDVSDLRLLGPLSAVPPDRATEPLTAALVSGAYYTRPAATRMIARRDFPPTVTLDAATTALDAPHGNTRMDPGRTEIDRISIADAVRSAVGISSDDTARSARVLGLYARGLCAAPQAQRAMWLGPMDAAVQSKLAADEKEARARRSEIIRAIKTPSREAVIAALESTRSTADATGAPHIEPLLSAWR
jgi:hypothetical protein